MMSQPRILVIRGGAIGDFILTLPAIKLLRENFPRAHLEILGYQHIVALAENRFYADRTRSIEYAALARFFIPNAELDDGLIEYFASFQQVVSYLYDPDRFFENNLRRCGVKHFLHAPPRLDDSAHAAQQLAQPLQQLALYLEDAAATLHPSAEDKDFAGDFLRDAPTPLVALHPGSGSEKKNWPVEKWLALGHALLAHPAQPALLLLGGEADHKPLHALSAAWKKERVLVARDFALCHVAALLERATIFIGHDSGISHIAAAVGAPCLLLFGPTDPDTWAPKNPQVRVLRAADGNPAQITLEAVREAMMEMSRDSTRELHLPIFQTLFPQCP